MANRVYDALSSVKASEELKASTLRYLQGERERRAGRPSGFFGLPVSMRSLSAAVCLVFLLTAGGFGYTIVRTPVSYISIDVNPSIELALNRLDRVVSAAAYNEDGEIVLDGISVKGKPYVEAIDTIVESDAMSRYLTEGAALTFTVASNVTEKEEVLQAGVEQSHGCRGHGGQSINADVGIVPEAHGHGLSFGKYAAYLALAQYDESVTVEDCQNMSMAEIHNQIGAHEHGCAGGNGAAGEDSGANAGSEGSGSSGGAGSSEGSSSGENSTGNNGCAVHGRSYETEPESSGKAGHHRGRKHR